MEKIITILLSVAVGAYACSFITMLAKKKKAGFALFTLGWLVNLSIFVLNWIACYHPPFGNMYHVLIFLSLSFFPLYLLLNKDKKLRWLDIYFVFTAVIPLIGSLCMGRDVFWKRVPALQSAWFVPHVFAYMTSYALAAVAFSIMITGRIKKKTNTNTYRQASYDIIRIAFPLMTFGMLSGALWAEEAWGVYWSWDPKETWSLITWTLYIIYFHCRLDSRLNRWIDFAHLLAFIALVTTFVVVNLLPKFAGMLHSYA